MLVKRYDRDGYRAIKLQGIIHTMQAMDADSNITPVLIQITRMNDVLCALLDQEDVDELYAFLGNYVTEQ